MPKTDITILFSGIKNSHGEKTIKKDKYISPPKKHGVYHGCKPQWLKTIHQADSIHQSIKSGPNSPNYRNLILHLATIHASTYTD